MGIDGRKDVFGKGYDIVGAMTRSHLFLQLLGIWLIKGDSMLALLDGIELFEALAICSCFLLFGKLLY